MTTTYDEPEPLGAEETLRKAHDATRTRLADKRAARDALNVEIKALVRDENLLARALHVFDRAARKEASDAPA